MPELSKMLRPLALCMFSYMVFPEFACVVPQQIVSLHNAKTTYVTSLAKSINQCHSDTHAPYFRVT